jgi:hypothetical protein
MQDLKEKEKLPKELQEITVLYSDDIDGEIKNLKDYILAITDSI